MKKFVWIAILLLALVVTAVACTNTPSEPDTTAGSTVTETPTEAPDTPTTTDDPSEETSDASSEPTTTAEETVPPPDPAVQNAPLISPEAFMDPANEYRALNIEHGYPGGSIAERVQQLKDLGFGGVATNDPFTDSYLQSPESLSRFNDFLQALHAEGLRVWLYDEKGYPSGSAGDLTCAGHPEYEAVRLTQITVKGSGSGEASVALPDAFVQVECASLQTDGGYLPLEVTVGDGQMTFKGTDGAWVAYIY
ncbi:MAG: hypothetical protein IJX72_00620 [Clostridia bacterium]|nr:hypothetical protein [Clostridia bacterium]